MPPTAVAEVAPIDAPPQTRLAFDPEISSIEDAAVALHELAWLESRLATERAKIDQAIRLLKAEAEQRHQIKVGRNNTTLSERAGSLAAALQTFVEANPDEICIGNKKTRKFTHGEISLRATKLSVTPLEDYDWDQVLEEARELGYKRFVKLKYSLDKTRIISDLAPEKLTDVELESLHLNRLDPHDEVKIKPGHYTVEAPAAL